MKTIFFLDLDTQKDFLLSKGALPVAGGERLIPKLRRLFDFARKNAITVVSPVLARTAAEGASQSLPPHCVIGTDGQRKLDDTLLHRPLTLENRPMDINVLDSVRKHQQIIVPRSQWDPFGNPMLARLLRALPGHAFAFGVPAEHSVRLAVIGLRERGVKAAVLSDVVVPLDHSSWDAAAREMRTSGTELITLETLINVYLS
jgi:nicotinamidase-related amidase